MPLTSVQRPILRCYRCEVVVCKEVRVRKGQSCAFEQFGLEEADRRELECDVRGEGQC